MERAVTLQLYDRADGVEGHYCIGRQANPPFAEFWNPDGWAGSGFVFEDERLAQAVLKLLQNESAPPSTVRHRSRVRH
jgi:hypothetical protein